MSLILWIQHSLTWTKPTPMIFALNSGNHHKAHKPSSLTWARQSDKLQHRPWIKTQKSKNITNHKQWTSSTKIYWTKSTKKKQHVHFHVFHPLLYLQLLSVISISSSLEVTGPSVAHKQWRQKPEKSGKSLRFTDRRLPQKGPEISWSCQELASILG